MDNGREMVSQALQRFCEGKVGLTYIPPGCPSDNGYVESFNNRLEGVRPCECSDPNVNVSNRRDKRVSKLRIGDGAAIRRTSPSSSETILTWTPAGTAAVR